MLPPAFFTPNEHNVRGGVEFSFMSCSKSRGVAMQYATHKGEDRGAPLEAPHRVTDTWPPASAYLVTLQLTRSGRASAQRRSSSS